MSKAKHPFHLVDPSPWPILMSFALLMLTGGIVLHLHAKIDAVFFAGLASVFGCMYGWWRDVIDEAEHQHAHSKIAQIGLKIGMGLFIASEVMFFFAFFWAFFNSSLFPKEATGFVWPPKNIKPLATFDLPLLNTLILLMSGSTLTWAHHAIQENIRKDAVIGLAITVALGVSFLCLQATEYHHATFAFKDGVYPSVFYMATGFHGLHVMIGTLFLLVCLIRTKNGHFTADHHVGLEAAAWYWHFVDVVWLFLFVSVYWWGNGA